MPMLPSRPPLWVCGGDTDARHLPISASSIIENSRKQPASSSRRWNYRAGAQLKCIGCCVLAPCDVEHCKPAARGLLSFLSLLRAFLLNAIKHNQARGGHPCRPRRCACPLHIKPVARAMPGMLQRKGSSLPPPSVFLSASALVVCCCCGCVLRGNTALPRGWCPNPGAARDAPRTSREPGPHFHMRLYTGQYNK